MRTCASLAHLPAGILREELLIGLGRIGCRRGAPILFLGELLQALARGGHQRAVGMLRDELLVRLG